MAVEQYHEMTRAELRAFDAPVQDLLIEMMGEGWTGRRSRGSHIQLQGPDLTTRGAISPSNINNINYLRQLRNRGSVGSVKPAQPKQAVKKFKCPRPDCYKVYASLEYLNAHINVDHEHKLKCPDCDYYGDSLRRVNLHRSREHGYESPKKAQRLRAAAERAEQKLVASPPAVEAQAAPATEPSGSSAFRARFLEDTRPAAPTVEESPVEQAVPTETTDSVGTQSLELAPIRDLTVAQLIAVAAAMGKTVEITVR